MKRVILTVAAERDLVEIIDYIAERNPTRALSLAGELRAACLARAHFPYGGRRRRDISDDLLTFPYGRYLIVYSVEADHLLIRRILHGARDIDRLLREDME